MDRIVASDITLRKKFLDFWAHYGHNVVPSDSLIPSSDPTMLFTSAGMVQFKKYFTGELKMSPPKAVSCQKCLRTSDIEKIGHTPHHLSFFEMLGNFSFGDYFKNDAINWAWEFLTKDASLPKEKLYASVYKEDEEAYDIWRKILPADRIYKLSEETNFWNMGTTGPCGPCSEIIYDMGAEKGCGKKGCSPSCTCNRWLEVWNLVFTQYDRQDDGSLVPLPNKNIDTGMGIERLMMVCDGKDSVFDTSLFQPIIKEIEKHSDGGGKSLQVSAKPNRGDVSLQVSSKRIISDHLRAMTFLIADGVLPSNEGRGYIVRRLIRRGTREIKRAQGVAADRPLLYKLTSKVIEMMKDVYPELSIRKENVATIIKMEEEKFLETLGVGMSLLDDIMAKVKKTGAKNVPGNDVFVLYDTYGFPQDLTAEILSEAGLTYDRDGFDRLQLSAKETAKKSWKGVAVTNTSLYKSIPAVSFIGYEHLSSESKITGIIKNGVISESIGRGEEGEIILDTTPFYAEAGGQVGDTGSITCGQETAASAAESGRTDGTFHAGGAAEVLNTTKPTDTVSVHHVKVTGGEFKVGQIVIASVDVVRRKKIMSHHTATHLLHKALKSVLGGQGTQSGSLVAPERFRFDFAHFKALSEREMERIEDMVNEKIMECHPVRTVITTLKQAKEWNVTALFGEKYSESVRCVIIGDAPVQGSQVSPAAGTPSTSLAAAPAPVSMELCGGTHCKNTGEIGMFKIISETSIGSGLRRIEAVCGIEAMAWLRQSIELLNAVADKLKSTPADSPSKIETLIKKQKTLEKEIENTRSTLHSSKSKESEYKVGKEKDKILAVQSFSDEQIAEKNLRAIADQMKDKRKSGSIIMVSNAVPDKVSFVITATEDLLGEGIDSGRLAKEFAKLIQGSGGGRKDFAQGGGRDVSKFKPALEKLAELLDKM